MSILDKVRKLRALAQSSNEHEARAAAAAAQRLITEHNLAEAELHVSAPDTTDPIADTLADVGQRAARWETGLAVVIARHNGCRVWLGNQRIGIAGRPEDVETVRYLYTWLVSETNRLAARLGKGKGKSWANSFRLGMVSGYSLALDQASQAARQNATSAALVALDTRLTKAAKVMPPTQAVKRAPSPVRDTSAYYQGVEHGKQAATAPKRALAG